MSREPAPAAGTAAPLRTRIAALHAELGPTGIRAGSLVTKSVPAGAVAVGSPARVVRDRG